MAKLIVALIVALVGCALSAQLSGTYTCANGNPGNAFDYGDIGDFFDDLETLGVSGQVTLDLYDDGGVFSSTVRHILGFDHTAHPTLAKIPIVGLNASTGLIIRAATGETPVIEGGGPTHGAAHYGALSFYSISHTLVEGLTIRNGDACGIFWTLNLSSPAGDIVEHVRVSKCRIHSMRGGAIQFLNYGSPTAPSGMHNVAIENNMCWNCGDDLHHVFINAVIGSWDSGSEWVVRHNTILQLDSHVNAFGQHFSTPAHMSTPWSNLDNNVVYLTSQSPSLQYLSSDLPFPVNINGNVVFVGGQAVVSWSYTWAQWQAAGRDTNGMNADPLLVNMTPGFEDLRLLPGSPAIDRAGPPGLTVDIFGNLRPYGPFNDSGAHECQYPLPDIEVAIGTIPIPSGSSFGLGAISNSGIPFTFTIRNIGAAPLDLTGSPLVELAPGTNCGPATLVQSQPGLTTLAPTASTSFVVFIDPAATGALDLSISIDNSDAAKNPYTFTLTGTGTPANGAATAVPVGGSPLVGPTNGPFVYAIDPGATLTNAALVLSDPETDWINVIAITPPAALPAGVTGPTAPPLGHPLQIQWSGVADAANTPGFYTWSVQFADLVNGTVINTDVTLAILDKPPTHLNVGALPGDGSAGNPYRAEFTQGDDASMSRVLAAISDANAGQTPVLGGVTAGATNPAGGAGFSLVLSSGNLSVAPAGMLLAADRGTHGFTVEITSALHTVTLHISVFVYGATGAISFGSTTLPDALLNRPYSAPVQVSGATGAVSFSITGGALPPGLTLDSTTGVVSGAAGVLGPAVFTVTVVDSTSDTATQQLTLEVVNAPPANSAAPGGDSGCSANRSAGHELAGILALLCAIGAAVSVRALRRPGTHPAAS